ncbi:MAG TPA: hypothetical protein VEV43_02045 [Actinomycetota bacterium]|nr:hypothetical protein [Actinomycetota bacterium]
MPVVVEGHERVPHFSIVDSGSLHNRFDRWIARMWGIDLTGATDEIIGLGGFSTVARTVTTRLSIGGFAWEAPVSFCEPWPLDFQLRGQGGCFRWFEVTIRAADLSIDLEPEVS